MDKKKKIIVGAVGVGCFLLLIIMIKMVVFPGDKNKPQKSQLVISTPEVIKKKIENKSKIEHYDRESLKNIGKNDIVKGLGNVGKEEEELFIEEALIVEDTTLQNPNQLGDLGKGSLNPQNTSTLAYQQNSEDEELRQLMALQEQLLAQANAPTPTSNDAADIQEIQKLLAAYDQYSANGENTNQLTPDKISEIGTSVSEKLIGQINTQFQSQNFFHGAQSSNDDNKVLGLIPAETIDDRFLVNGSTVAIRTKKEIRLANPRVVIPKGAVVYGKVSFGTNRLLIDIDSYKTKNTLYKLDFTLFDFDGLEGIHLDSRTWPKIPGKVAKDVYDYAYQRGTQAAGFGSENNSVNLEEAKDIAILSAAKEIGNEVFEKRKVFMPKKYHLWFNINTQ